MRPTPALVGAAIAFVLPLTTLVVAPVSAAPASVPAGSGLELSFMPVLPGESRAWPGHDIQDMAMQAADWLEGVSGGAIHVSGVNIQAPIKVDGQSCRELARAASLSQVQRRGDASTVWIYLGDATDCPYLGLAEMRGSWIVISSPGDSREARARTLVHELGHTLGLAHAAAQGCSILQDTVVARPRDCPLLKYGDRTDPMGRGSLAWGLNPINSSTVGWEQDPRELEGSTQYRVNLRLGVSTDAVRVADPVSGDVFVVAYRTPLSTGLGGRRTDAEGRGVYLYRLPRASEPDVGSVLLPWTDSLRRLEPGRAGHSYVAPGGGFAIQIRSEDPRGATAEVHVDALGRLTDVYGPVFSGDATGRARGDRTLDIRFPRALDQSGIRRYEVRIGQRVVQVVKPATGVAAYGVTIETGDLRDGRVSVRAIDALGNSAVMGVLPN